MKRFKAYYIISILISLFYGNISAKQEVSVKLLVAGSANNKIMIFDKNSKQLEWVYYLENDWECNSVARTDHNEILFSYGRGARLIKKDKTIVWDIKVSSDQDLQSASILPNGNFLLAASGHPAFIREIDCKGNILNEITFETGIEDPHFQFRRIAKTSSGNYLIPLFAKGKVLELSSRGKVLCEFSVEGNPFAIRELPNGNYLVSGGDSHCFTEINSSGDIIKKIESSLLKDIKFQFVAEVIPEKDHYYICNWQGHEKQNPKTFENPAILEIDRMGNVIWSLSKWNTIGFISAIYIFNE